MEMYILKSALCLATFFVFYKALLENTSLHSFKRFYLLLAVLVSFIIPFITFSSYQEIETATDLTDLLVVDPETHIESQYNYIGITLWTIYGLGVLFFGIKFLRNLSTMIYKIRRNPKKRSRNIINVLLTEQIVPHTFFHFIFFNRRRFEAGEIPQQVIDHELTHAREKHSLDILLIELCLVVFWFNPLFHYMKRAIKLNHEFLADRSVLKTGTDTTDYQKTLLAFSSNASTPQLANSINYSFIKKRFTVMKTKTSRRATWWRSMLLLPLLAIVLFSFSSREIIPIETDDLMEDEILQTSATREEMREYTRLAKKYNAMTNGNMNIKQKDLKRMEYIYHKMSPKQKADAEPFPVNLPPPPPPAPEIADVPNPNAAPKAVEAPKPVKVIAGVNDNDPNLPPPPPPPPEPEPVLDHIIRMAKKGATFYYEGEKISSDKAISLIKANDQLNVHSSSSNSGKPVVKITTKPIKLN
ncbi:MAG: hypothetical protein DWP94_00295 [Flavobacterium sp.]|nr:MAG: hypothetical protein DWP94_00295 [Flavobacterium sp.]